MVFSTTNLFKAIPCPHGEQCSLTNCIFSHDLRPKQSETSAAMSTTHPIRSLNSGSAEPETKRRKITYETLSEKPLSKADQIRSELAVARSGSTVTATKKQQHSPNGNLTENGNQSQSQPRSFSRSISPPRTERKAAPQQTTHARADNDSSKQNGNKNDSILKSSSSSSIVKIETPVNDTEKLNPRLITNDPAGHAKRSLYLKHLHDAMALLNENVRKSSSSIEHKTAIVLTEHQLVKMALDEEERVAREQPMVYANIIKNRIALYRKMKVEDWTKQVQIDFEKKKQEDQRTITPPAVNKELKPIETDLTREEEVSILPHLIADQSTLSPYGYIPTPPTAAQAVEAAAAVQASHNYEVCDRCSARFQVFPDRNEEGLLTSNGPCKHHPNKKIFPARTKGDNAMGHVKEAYFPCCNGVLGSPGCTEKDFHVFKAGSPGRLAAVMPFINTPENDDPAKDGEGKVVKAVSFDCEMGYTVYGMELIRVTAVAWPSGKELVDVLVRPLGSVIDLNSRFSGVWPEHFSEAVEYNVWKSTKHTVPDTTDGNATSPTLPIVSSPQKARALLCSFLTPTTPLIGHAIDNDLNAIRLCHPTIIDTVLLFPHPRGLPLRFGLKMLASKYLGQAIQMGGDRGHDSLEDARATGELVRVKVGEKWRALRSLGWKIGDGGLIGPEGKGGGDVAAIGKKRRKKWPGVDCDNGKGDESTEDEEIPGSGEKNDGVAI